MAKKYLDYDGLLYFWQKIKNLFAPLASPTFTGTPSAPTATSGTNTTQIATTAFVQSAVTDNAGEMNQNAFSNIKVGSTTIAADAETDTFELVAGSNVTLTPNAANDKVTIAAADTTYSDFTGATSSAAGTHGLVPAPASGKNNNILFGDGTWDELEWSATVVSNQSPRYSVKRKNTSTSLFNVNITPALPAVNTGDGLMSGADKIKLDSIIMTNGIIDSSVLPSFVDDVIEAYPRSNQTELSNTWLATGSASGTVITPEAGKIYVLMADSTNYAANTQFRWGGTAYVKLADGGVTSITNAEIDTIVAS